MTLHASMLSYVANSHESAWDDYREVKDKALRLGLHAAAAARWKGPGEPAFVAQLVSDKALSELRNALVGHLPAHLCNGEPLLSTAFIHQKPKVRFGSSEVELGDLLLVRHHFVYGQPGPEGRALLLQAKACPSPRTGGLRGNDVEQLKLYQHWPVIQFPYGEVGLSPNGTPNWDFKLGPSSASDAGCYGVVFARELPLPPATQRRPAFPEGSPWSVGLHADFRAASVDASAQSLAAALTGLVQGTRGRRFEAVPNGKDHWSAFINEVLKNAASEKWRYRLKRLDIEGRERLQHVAALSASMPALSFTVAATVEQNWWHLRRQRYHALARWVDRTFRDGRGNDNWDVPSLEGSGGGIQLLYLATFGDTPLDEALLTNKNGAR
jgi:hypothetical protein